MMVYFIKVVAFQLLFLVGYDLFLKKETFFNWNRVYLIFSSLISFVLPFIKLESLQDVVPQEYIILLPELVLTPQVAVAPIEPTWNWFLIIGIAVSSILFIYKITQLVKLRFKGHFVKHENYTLVIIPKSTLAFSIFRYVFIGEEINKAKLEDILQHELVHIREKHSLDLLYFEILRILCWFNPLVYIYQKRISEIHEYIADASVVQNKNKSDYYEKLLAEVFQTQQFSFTNQFFKKSLIKKRIIMLTKQKSREILKLKYLVLVPMLVLALLYTSCEDTTISDTAENVEATKKLEKEAKLEDLYQQYHAIRNNVEDGKSLTQAQIEAQTQIIREIMALLYDDDKYLSKEFTPQLYEDFLKNNKGFDPHYEELQKEVVPFSQIDIAPIYPGCEGESTSAGIRKCLSMNVTRFVNKNFNMKLVDQSGLKGRQKIFAKFVIDKSGSITDIDVRAPHPDLASHVEDILNLLPKMIKPGMKDGKPVDVTYTLPIVFQLAQ
jgi:hypothetical protein